MNNSINPKTWLSDLAKAWFNYNEYAKSGVAAVAAVAVLSTCHISDALADICGLNGKPTDVAERLLQKIGTIVPGSFDCIAPSTLRGKITCLGSKGNHVSIVAADHIKYFQIYVVFDGNSEGSARAGQVLKVLSQEHAFTIDAQRVFELIRDRHLDQATLLLGRDTRPVTCSLSWKIDTEQFALGFAPGWR